MKAQRAEWSSSSSGCCYGTVPTAVNIPLFFTSEGRAQVSVCSLLVSPSFSTFSSVDSCLPTIIFHSYFLECQLCTRLSQDMEIKRKEADEFAKWDTNEKICVGNLEIWRKKQKLKSVQWNHICSSGRLGCRSSQGRVQKLCSPLVSVLLHLETLSNLVVLGWMGAFGKCGMWMPLKGSK